MKTFSMIFGAMLLSGTAVYSQTTALDLEPLGVAATIQAPANTKTVAGEWSNLITDDKNFNISVEETTSTLAERKDEIMSGGGATIAISGANGFVYIDPMMGRDLAHFEYFAEINGVTYRFYDKRVSPLDKEGVLPMYNAMLTLKGK